MLRKRRQQTNSTALGLNIAPTSEPFNASDLQINKLQNYRNKAQINTLISTSIQKNSESVIDNDETVEESTEKPLEEDISSLFQQLIDEINKTKKKNNKNLEKDLESSRNKYKSIITELNLLEESLGTGSSLLIWKHKQFFTELIDFIDHSDHIDLNDVNEEYLSLGNVLSKMKQIRLIDPKLYKDTDLGNKVLEIFEFYATIQTNEFSFLSGKPLVDLEWIRAGWTWTEEDGNPDLVPRVFERICLPILINRFSQEELMVEQDYRRAYLHCIEILDYCQNVQVANIQLMNIMKRKLQQSVGCGKMNSSQYQAFMKEFGFTNTDSWRQNF